ncbi:hypothetical protein SIO49_002500 [Citrobacter freundii]|nr:hypothetical protein [Citrobacter freundii]ELW9355683.1 hypothetical protein [Citrobacter freundii]
MIDKYRLDDLRLESGEKGELARWVIQLQTDLDSERRKVVAPPVPIVPSGWVLVPLVPTQEMCDAVLWSACPSLDGDGARFIYNVMTDVAPYAPSILPPPAVPKQEAL